MGRRSVVLLVCALGAASVAACAAAPPPETRVATTETPPATANDDDELVIGFAQADHWVRAGHPRTGADAALFEKPLCTAYGTRRHRSDPSCERPFYRAAVDQRARFARELALRGDALLTGTVLADLNKEFGADAAIALARELDDDESMWRAGMLAVAEDVRPRSTSSNEPGAPRKVAEEAWRHARARRTHAARGGALYVFARIAEPQVSCYSECSDVVDWAHFGEWFGERMGADDFGAFLDVDRGAWRLAHVVAPALAPGWSRAKVILARLAARSSEDYELVASDARAAGTLLCREGDERGLRELAQYFRASAPGHPPRTALVASFDEQAKRCGREH